MTGVKAASRALPYILENSRSPRESSIGLLLSLPLAQGGEALHGLRLNHRIDIPEKFCRLTDRSYFVADFFWPGKPIAGEYDSDVAHSGDEPHITDAIKRNVLPAMGYTPFSFTRLQVNQQREMNKSCENLRFLLGIKSYETIPIDYEQRKSHLRQELLQAVDNMYQIPLKLGKLV